MEGLEMFARNEGKPGMGLAGFVMDGWEFLKVYLAFPS